MTLIDGAKTRQRDAKADCEAAQRERAAVEAAKKLVEEDLMDKSRRLATSEALAAALEEAKQAQMSDYETKMQELLSNLHNMEKDMDGREATLIAEIKELRQFKTDAGAERAAARLTTKASSARRCGRMRCRSSLPSSTRSALCAYMWCREADTKSFELAWWLARLPLASCTSFLSRRLPKGSFELG